MVHSNNPSQPNRSKRWPMDPATLDQATIDVAFLDRATIEIKVKKEITEIKVSNSES